MKAIFRTIARLASLATIAACIPIATAQEEQPDVGFLRVVNVVAPGQGNMNVLIDGEDLYPKGYLLGKKTGGFGLKAGAHTISIKKTGVTTGSTKFTLAKGETLSLIAFAEEIPPEKKGDPPQWQAKILRLKQSDPESGYRLAFISLCAKDEIKVSAQIEGKPKPDVIYAKRLVVTGINIGKSKKETEVKVGDQTMAMVSMDAPGNYVVIFYENEAGEIKGLSFFDPKFVIAG